MEWGAPVSPSTAQQESTDLGNRLFIRVQARLKKEGKETTSTKSENLRIFEEELLPHITEAAAIDTETPEATTKPRPAFKRRGSTGALFSLWEEKGKEKEKEEETHPTRGPRAFRRSGSTKALADMFEDNGKQKEEEEATHPTRGPKAFRRSGSTKALADMFEGKEKEREEAAHPMRGPKAFRRSGSTKALADMFEEKGHVDAAPPLLVTKRRGSTGNLSSLVKNYEDVPAISPRQQQRHRVSSPGAAKGMVKRWEGGGTEAELLQLPIDDVAPPSSKSPRQTRKSLPAGKLRPFSGNGSSRRSESLPNSPVGQNLGPSPAVKRHRLRALQKQKEWENSMQSLLSDI